jgi:rhodanese-related sulfurtransferase
MARLNVKNDQTIEKMPRRCGFGGGGEKVIVSRGRTRPGCCEIRMKDNSDQSGVLRHLLAVRQIFGEAVLVAVLGAAFAFAANQFSPRGLVLTRDYFPTGIAHQVRPAASAVPQPATSTNPVPISAAAFLAEQMRQKGLQLIDGRQALQYFHDPRLQQDMVVFVDARKEEEYQKGHIPGAYEFDPYRSGKYYDVVLPVCQKAEQVVVYCNGGDCDDSETAALQLRDMGIPNQKLFVYGGGITEWETNSLPMEIGARNSGSIRKQNQ